MRINSRAAVVLLSLIAVAALSVSGVSYPAEAGSISSEALQAFERFVAERMAGDRIPGLSIGFIEGDFSWARGFGWADVENQSPAKPESSYRLASISKTITAAAILKLAEEGKIKLDAEIQAYVPYFPRKKWPVTVRQLLGHLSGIPHYRNDAVESHIKEPKDTRQSLAIFQDFPLVAEPGTRYVYSSYGYDLLGAAVEGASGLPFGLFLKTRIFDPLGMTDSRLDNPGEIIPNRVRGYQLVNGRLRNSEYVDISSRFGAGGIRSTVLDLLTYARGIMKGDILNKATWRMMFTTQVLPNGQATWYGLGWRVRPWNGHFSVGHTGSQPETRTQLLLLPEDGIAVAAACNLEGANLLPYVRRLADLALEEESGLLVYTSGRVQQSIYQAVSLVFEYGLSAYLWNSAPLTKDWDNLRRAFDYLQENAGERSLEKDYDKAKKNLQAGIHPASGQALTKVGSYMAWALEEAGGRGSLRAYHQRGPIAFFNDYIRLSSAPASSKRHPRFGGEFTGIMAVWEKDWARTYTEEFRRLAITPRTDFEALLPKLKNSFAGASICPDISPELAEAADNLLDKNEGEKAMLTLSLGREVYPASPLLAAALGYVQIWRGRFEEGRKLYLEAKNLDAGHPVLGPEQFLYSIRRLVQADKAKEAQDLGLIGVDMNPNEPSLYAALGELSILGGRKEEAARYFRKALQVDPNFEEARTRLKSLEK
jgi:CubicO group peptidase (beta-lactamase class C family)